MLTIVCWLHFTNQEQKYLKKIYTYMPVAYANLTEHNLT